MSFEQSTHTSFQSSVSGLGYLTALTSKFWGSFQPDQELKISAPVQLWEDPWIVIVGAGPVGLWTAIQCKLLMPRVRVLVLDKRYNYTRTHTVFVDKASTETNALHLSHELQQVVLDMARPIPTDVLESKLFLLAKHHGVDFEKGDAMTLQRLQQENITNFNEHTRVLALIAADGAHSVTRQGLFGDAMSVYEESMYALELKYKTRGETQALDATRKYSLTKLAGMPIQEHVSFDARDGNGRVTLRLILSVDLYVQCAQATFRAPWYLKFECTRRRVPQPIMRAITLWLNCRKIVCEETRVRDSERLTTVKLAPYRAAVFSRTRAFINEQALIQTPVFLVGDAAFGVPFFRSLNNGLLAGTELAETLQSMLENLEHNFTEAEEDLWIQHALNRYNGFMKDLSEQEIMRSRTKRSLLDVYDFICHVNASSPLQVIQFTAEEVRRLEESLY